MNRPFRRLAMVLLAGIVVGGMATNPADADPVAAAQIDDLGPASSVTSINGSEFNNGRLYLATGGISPTKVGVYDPAVQRVVSQLALPAGGGAWATASIGTDVYIGTYTPARLYKIDTTNGTVTQVATAAPDSFIWAMDASPDGKIYMGTYPTGRVLEYDPATNQTRDLGAAVPGEQYVRSIVANETTVYAGVGAHAHLIAIDRASGTKTDILPAELADRTFVATLTLEGNVLAAGMSATGNLLLLDTTNPSDYTVVAAPGDAFVTAITIDAARNDIYIGTRPSGTLYRYDRDDGSLDKLVVPYDGAYFNRIFIDGDKLLAVLTSQVVTYDLSSGDLSGVDLTAAGMPPAPELAMAITADMDRVYVSGKAGVQVHDLAARTNTRVFLPGEAKAMTPVRDQIYLSVYTLAFLFRLDPSELAIERLASMGQEQTRPLDAYYDAPSELLLMGTQPEYGRIGGALAAYHTRTGELRVVRDIIPNQSVRSITVMNGVAYIASEIYNGLGTEPIAKEAVLAAVDLRTMRVLWQTTPVAGATRITDLTWAGRQLYGLTDTGVLFELDPSTRAVTRTTSVGTGQGTLVKVRNTIYGVDSKMVYRVTTRGAPLGRVPVAEITPEWYGGSVLLAAHPTGRALYALKGRNLVRITL